MSKVVKAPGRRLPERDLQEVLEATSHCWAHYKDARFFITGGTGFLGSWLLQTLVRANREFELGIKVTVLTRTPDPSLLQLSENVQFIRGDIRHFELPDQEFTHVIHAAGETWLDHQDEVESVSVEGTRRLLDTFTDRGIQSLLYLSSGSVYQGCSSFQEDQLLQHCPEPTTGYARGKRRAEQLCLEWGAREQANLKIARCFTFLGPGMSLENPSAAASFLSQALAYKPIQVQNGSPVRSYMYAADFAIWIWTLLTSGESNIYNVGSSVPISVIKFAEKVANAVDSELLLCEPRNFRPALATQVYVPDTHLANDQLSLTESVGLTEAIERTLSWFQDSPLPSLTSPIARARRI